MTSKFSWHSVLQVLATVGQVGNVAALALQKTSPTAAGITAVVVGCIQVVLHQYGYNAPSPSGN